VTEPDDLYGLPLERFVAERTALAKALRKDGEREQANAVASLRKPSVAAWAVNQLVRTRAREVESLFAAGDALERGQSDLLAGRGDARALREVVTREREAVDALTDLARGLLSSGGHELTTTTLERVSQSLHAAALDEDARAQVKAGCLTRELRHVGLGQGGLVGQAGPVAGRAKAESAGRERAEEMKAARRAESDARRALERAEHEMQAAQTRRDEAAESLRRADDALTEAREAAERATREHDRADQRLQRL
jgi:hypothetical protein